MPAPDVNTNEQTMAWIMDTYSMHARHTVTAVVTGKPMALGGSRGRPEATGRGCMIVTLKALKRLGLKPEDSTRGDSGLRQRGRHGGEADGARRVSSIVAIIEYDGAVYNRNGLDIAALAAAPQGDRLHRRLRRRRRHGQATKPCSWSATCCCRRPRRT